MITTIYLEELRDQEKNNKRKKEEDILANRAHIIESSLYVQNATKPIIGSPRKVLHNATCVERRNIFLKIAPSTKKNQRFNNKTSQKTSARVFALTQDEARARSSATVTGQLLIVKILAHIKELYIPLFLGILLRNE